MHSYIANCYNCTIKYCVDFAATQNCSCSYLLEELVITKEDKGQDLGLHLMVIQQSLINANLTMRTSTIVS